MGIVIGTALGVTATVLLLALTREWLRYSRGHHTISRRQMAVRTVTCCLLVGVLVMVAVGLRVTFGSFDDMMAYWGTAMVMAAVAMGMAIWDLRQVRGHGRRQRAEGFMRLSAYIRRLERGRGGQPGGQ